MKRFTTGAVAFLLLISVVGFVYAQTSGTSANGDVCKGKFKDGQVKACGLGQTTTEAGRACQDNMDSFCNGVCYGQGHQGGQAAKSCQVASTPRPNGGYVANCNCEHCECYDGFIIDP